MDPSSKFCIVRNSIPLNISKTSIYDLNIAMKNEGSRINTDNQITTAADTTSKVAELNGVQFNNHPLQSISPRNVHITMLFFIRHLVTALTTSIIVHYFLLYLIVTAIYVQSLAIFTSDLKWIALLINSLLFPLRIILYHFLVYMFTHVYKSKNEVKQTFLMPISTITFEYNINICMFHFMLRDFSILNWVLQCITIQFSEPIILFTYTPMYRSLQQYFLNFKIFGQKKQPAVSPDIVDGEKLDVSIDPQIVTSIEIDHLQKRSAVRLLRCIWIGKILALLQTVTFYLLYQVRNKTVYRPILHFLLMDKYLVFDDSLSEMSLKFVFYTILSCF